MEVVVVLDSCDPEALAGFWCEALHYRRARQVGPYIALLPEEGQTGPELLLQAVPEPKVRKNRSHLDIRISDIAGEAERLKGLGATLVSDGLLEEDGVAWYVMADPEGNEFCILTE